MTDLGHGFCGDTDFTPTHHLDDAVTDVIALDQHEDEQEKNHASKSKCDMKWPEQALQLRDRGVLGHNPDWSGVVGFGGTERSFDARDSPPGFIKGRVVLGPQRHELLLDVGLVSGQLIGQAGKLIADHVGHAADHGKDQDQNQGHTARPRQTPPDKPTARAEPG